MDEDVRSCLIRRAEMVLSNLRVSQSGADVHKVENMKHTASLIIRALADQTLDIAAVNRILERLESDQVAYFRKKFET